VVASSGMVIHNSTIAKFTLPGGKVFSYARGICKEVAREAKFLAPVRTGRLRNSIDSKLGYANQHECEFRVYAGTGHALFVSFGTNGHTVAHGAPPMHLYGSFPGGWLNTQYARFQGAPVRHVDGQIANPYLQTALRAVLVQHGLI
jgi:hypothetical protein